MTAKLLATLLAAGWLAEALAGKNSDVEAGVAAYTSGDHEAALAAYAAAEATLGERPEIFYNRGLALLAKDPKDAAGEARKAFERGTESTDPRVHASSEYELGNLDLDAEAFDAAIERYTKCLKSQPTHANAKWNLELALLKKKQKEEEEKKKEQEEKNKDENKDEKQDEQKQDEKQDEQKQDEQKQDEQKQDEKKDEQKQDEKKDEQKQDEKQDEQKQDEKKDEQKDEQKQDEQKQQPQPQPQPLDKADLAKALEQLDAEDPFLLGRPGRPVPVEKDW